MAVSLRYDSPPLSGEKWAWVVGHEGRYDVSSLGRVRTYYKSFGRNGRRLVDYPVDFLWPNIGPQGYGRIGIHVGTSSSVSLHSLVLAAFVGPRPNGAEILHGDGDPSNNELVNLRYGTQEENTKDWVRHARDGKTSAKTVEWSLARTRDRRVGMRINLLHSSLERWKPVVGYEGRYDVSELGNMRTYLEANRRVVDKGTELYRIAASPHPIKTGVNNQGYSCASLVACSGRSKKLAVHRLVLSAFVGPRHKGKMARHMNGIRTDARLENLVYGTASENQTDRVRHGTSNQGERCGSAKFCDDEVRLIRAWCASGYSQKSVGEAFHCDSGTTSMIVNHKTWRHI